MMQSQNEKTGKMARTPAEAAKTADGEWNANSKAGTSSAAGLTQFLKDSWLDMTNALRSLSLALLFTSIATGCSRAEPATAEASGSQNGGSTQTAAVQLNGQCRGARNALASCAEAKTCDDDIAMFLPAASRDALIVLENKPGYSSDAFDGYCLKACQSRSAAVDEAAFAGDVCGSAPSPAAAATNPPAAAQPDGSMDGQGTSRRTEE